MKPVRRAFGCALTIMLCFGGMMTGAGMETEKDVLPETERENVYEGEIPSEGGEILAGPVELNSYPEELIIDDSTPQTGTPQEDAVSVDEAYEKETAQGEDSSSEERSSEPAREQAGMTETGETDPKKAEYRYEDSMSLAQLALLPADEAGAATEIEKAVPGAGDGKMMLRAASAPEELWTCSDYYVNEPDLYHVEKKEDFSLKYQIEFHTSTGLNPGSVEIRVPEALLTDRDLNPVIPSQIGIPEGTRKTPSESLNSPFNWYRDDCDGSLVFFNYRAIASGTNTAFQVLYHPVRIPDLVDGSAWSFVPGVSVTLADGSTQTRQLQELTGRIDSRAVLTGSSASAFADGSISCLPALYTKDQVRRILGGSLPPHLSGADGEWLFIAWQIDSRGEYSQPWTLNIDADLTASGVTGSADCCVVGSITKVTGTSEGSSGQGEIVKRSIAAQGSSTITELSAQDLKAQISQGMFHLTTVAVTAVRRNALRDNGSVLGLNASLVLTPLDGIDQPGRSAASATWTFVDYKWKYRGDDVGIFAWTGQRNADGSISYASRNVPLSGWINEYRLSQETLDAAGSVPVRILSECRGYSFTHETGGPAAGSYRPGTGYEVTTVDDVVYMSCLSGSAESGTQMLTSQDYYYSDISVTIRDRGMDIFEDRTCSPMPAAQCPGADRSTKIFVMYEGSSAWELAAQCPWDDSGKITYHFTNSQLAGKIWRVKVLHRAVDYDSSCTIDARLCIRPQSPVCGALVTQAGEDELTSLKIEHLGSVLARSTGTSSDRWFHDSDSSHYEGAEPGLGSLTMSLYGILSMRANSFAQPGSMKKHARALKTVLRENDPENGCVRLNCRIGAIEGYLIYSGQAAERIVNADSNVPVPDRSEYVIYDLLPEGVVFDPSAPVTAGLVMGQTDRDILTPSLWDDRNVSVRIDPGTGICRNWRHTGRDLVILHVSILLDGQSIPRVSDGMWMNGVGVQFGASCPYRDLKHLKQMPNVAVVMPGSGCDDPAEQILGSAQEAACDDGVVIPYTGDEKQALEVFGPDIDDDGVTNLRTVLYAYARTEADAAISLTDGIHLTVKADRDAYSDWGTDAHTGPGDPYTYRIDVTNSSSQPVSQLVVACHLERGAEERQAAESGRQFDDLTWSGFLETVDTEAVRREGIAPVVWLNTDPYALLPGEGHPPDSVLTSENGWIRLEDWTGEIKEAHSVAVDLRRKTDGSSFILDMGENVHLLLHMTAPGIGDGPGQTRAEHAYQCASFYSISQDEPDGDLVQGDAVEVTLQERTVLIVEKELTNEDEDPHRKKTFLFRLMRGSDAVPLGEYRLEERVTDAQGDPVWRQDHNLHTTGRSGLFSLKSGQRAVFENEAGGAALSAQEILPACYEASMREETAPEGNVCIFENTWYPTLYLTKKVYGVPEGTDVSSDVFRVHVTAGGKSLAGMSYWTVDRTGGLVEDEILEEHTVDADSCVLLHPGEVIALHPKDAECTWEIREEAGCGEGTDYVGVTTLRSGILGPEGSEVTLENAWRWKELVLRKEILHQGKHESNETFAFRLWRVREGEDAASFDPEQPQRIADPAAGIEGSMGEMTFRTDESGCFRLPCAGREVTLKHLEALAAYVIQEIDLPPYYEAVNSGLVSAVMPLLGSRRNVTVYNTWKKRSLEVSKAVLSGTHSNRTTVCTPGYPDVMRSVSGSMELFSASPAGMTGFTVTFPVQVKLAGSERIRVRSGSRDIDSFIGTIPAGTTRTYTGYSQVSLLLWGSRKNRSGFFFYLSPVIESAPSGGADLSGKRFTYLLEKEDEQGILRPAPEVSYLLSDGQQLQTDADGFFTLQAGMRALFPDLDEEGRAWRVTETADPSCPQVYPSGGLPQGGTLGEGGVDTTQAMFINGEDCQGMFRKQFSAAAGDTAAGDFLARERSKGTASSLRSVFLIEKENGSGAYEPLEGPVLVADATTGELLRCELFQGRICLTELQTVVLSGIPGSGSWRITETDCGFYSDQEYIFMGKCTIPGQEGRMIISVPGTVDDTVFVNEIHSFSVTQSSLIRKELAGGIKAWEKVPEGAVLALCLERYEDGLWLPEGGVDWVQCLDGIPESGLNRTGEDGIIRVRKDTAADPACPVLPIAISGGHVRTQLYYAEHEAQEGDLRIREVPDLSDISFGMLVGCDQNTFVNSNDMQTVVVEKQTDIESDQSFSMRIVQCFGDETLPGRYLPYQIRNAATREVTGSARCDGQGGFTLKGGYQAVFTLAQGTKWQVTEKSGGNWNLASCTMDQAVKDPEYIPRGVTFETVNITHNVTLTGQLLSETLRDPLTGQILDFTSMDLTIPHYVKLGDGILEITQIEDGLFSETALRSVVIEDGIRRIGSRAFFDCELLSSIRLPETLEELGDICFYCTAVQELVFPSSVRTVGEGITADCFNLTHVIIHQNESESPFSGYDWYTDTDITVDFTG